MPAKIGVLLPSSRMFPRLDHGFLAGLEGAFAESRLEVEIIVETTGSAALRDPMTEKVQRLLIQRPHVVTGIIGSGVAPHVHSFFRDSRTPFIVNNLGADPLSLGGEQNGFVFHNTLNMWQSAYALGAWAAANAGTKVAVATAFHEAGYDMIRAFSQAFAHLGGGTILGTEVTHRSSAVEDPAEQIRRLADLQPDFIAAFYSGREGVTFMRSYAELGLTGALPLVATPMLTHGNWLPQIGEAALGLRTASSWDLQANSLQHDIFRSACRVRREDEPAVFALLGYETGRLIQGALGNGCDDPADGEALCAGLRRLVIDSPRGTLGVDPETGDVLTTDYLQEVQQVNGGFEVRTVGRLDLPASCLQDRARYKAEPGRSGWVNPYLVN